MDGLGLTGALRTNYFSASRSLDGRSNLFGTTLQLKAVPRVTDSIDGDFEVRALDMDLFGSGRPQLSWQQAYLNFHFPDLDLRVGKQIVAWGRANEINPTDNLTPRDYTILLPFDEDQRSGVAGIKADYHLSERYTATLFLNYDFEPSTIPLPAPPGTSFVIDRPARSQWLQGFGTKLDETGGDADWSISYVHNHSLLPEAFATAGAPPNQVLSLHYPIEDIFGGDYATTWGRYGLRAEGAYFHPSSDIGPKAALQKPYLYLVTGIDRTFGDNFYVDFQVFNRVVFDYQNPASLQNPTERVLAQQNALIFLQQDPWTPGVTARVSDKWLNDTLQADIYFQANLPRFNWYVEPMVTYAITDHLKTTVGFQYFDGASNTFFGAQARDRNVFVELRYSFP